jgi:hypothetical protein
MKGGIMGECHEYKVTGTVKFFVDDVLSDSLEMAKEYVRENLDENLECACLSGNIEILELNSEDLGPCDEEALNYYHD